MNVNLNFRDYASKLRNQAKAAASKLPSFDDMAANDEYIHSEEFNVRGQERPHQSVANKTRDSSSTRGAQSTGTPPIEIDETSSMSSWSLLDRPMQLKSPTQFIAARSETSLVGAGTVVSEDLSIAGGLESTATSVSSGVPSSIQGQRSLNSSSHLPLLSVVANALESDPQEKKKTQPNEVSRSEIRHVIGSDDDDDSLASEEDEDDPIMSMVREQQRPLIDKLSKAQEQHQLRSQTRTPKSNIPPTGGEKTSGRRHIYDLNEKMDSLGEEMEEGRAQETQQTLEARGTSATTIMKSPLGSWMKNAAQNQFQRFLRHPTTSTTTPNFDGPQKQLAPLSRERSAVVEKKKTHEEFQVTASSSVLADDELAQLAKFKQSSRKGTLSLLTDSMHENRQFLFIFLTLVLGLYAYFFQRADDSVT